MRGGFRSLSLPAGVMLRMCVACAAALVLSISLAGCPGSTYTGPTNPPWSPSFQLTRVDIPAAGMTVLLYEEGPGEHSKKGELYLIVQAAEGQGASATADEVLSLVQKYKEQLHLNLLHVIVESSGEGLYDRTFDLTSSPSSTALSTTGALPATTTNAERTTTIIETAAHLYPVSVDGKWGYIDGTGTIKIQPQFDLAGDFSEGLAKVAMGDGPARKWGFIDKTGAVVIDPHFGNAGDFSDGLASVAEPGDSKPGGYIDTSGTLVIPMEYEGGSGFAEGVALVFVPAGGCAFIDKTGATVLGPYDYAWPFSEGLAYVEKAGGRGFVDTSGDWVARLESSALGVRENFSEGLALVEAPVPADAAHPGGIHFGYIDTSGGVAIEPKFDLALGFSEGLAAAAEYSGVPGDGVGSVDYRHGFVGKTGAWVIQPQYADAGPFSEGLAMVGAISGGKLLRGYIDKSGIVVIPLQYEAINVRPFSGGLARLDNGNDTSPTYIDKTGKVIWQGR